MDSRGRNNDKTPKEWATSYSASSAPSVVDGEIVTEDKAAGNSGEAVPEAPVDAEDEDGKKKKKKDKKKRDKMEALEEDGATDKGPTSAKKPKTVTEE